MKINVALLQFHPISGELKENRKKVNQMIDKAMHSEQKPDLIVLPETWTSIYSNLASVKEQAKINEETINGESISLLKELAKKYHIWISGGSITLKKDETGKYYNAQFLINREGETVTEYDKIHLCKWVHEDDVFEFGGRPNVIQTELGMMGLIVCYDIRFPELVTRCAVSGAEILIVPACFSTSLYHWRHLLIARAIENQMYVLGCNCCRGVSGEEVGHSMIVNPLGEVMGEAENEEAMITATIDLDEIRRVRESVTYINDRRPDIY